MALILEAMNEQTDFGKNNRNNRVTSNGRSLPTATSALDDGVLVELLYDPASRSTALVRFKDGESTVHDRIETPAGETLVPYSPDNNLISTGAVLLPSEPGEAGEDHELVADITSFIHRYVDLSPTFETVAAYYVLLTWVYDAFNELPYLRLRGDYGTGKTRALITIGSICNKPFFASGASTVSPIFHTLDAFAGTLLIDEADFRVSDERADIVKILNNGNVRGMPILRTMQNNQKEFNPRAFRVFGPKIVATRGEYEDKALESRFLTEVMGRSSLRADIPINLPDRFRDEALELRNRLLGYRFNKRNIVGANAALVDRSLEPRANQVLLPLLSLMSDPADQELVRDFAKNMQAERVAERSVSTEAQVLEVLCRLIDEDAPKSIAVGEITKHFIELFGDEYGRPVSNRWMGERLRAIGLRTFKSHGVYVVGATDIPRVVTLCERFGISVSQSSVPVE